MKKQTQTQTAIAKRPTLIIDLPDSAPALGFDPTSAAFDWTDILPDNYWSMESLEEKRIVLGGWPVYTPSHVAIQQVIDPTDKTPDTTPKPVLHFEENCPALVLNKSRCQMLSNITRTRNPAYWAERLTALTLEVGVYNGKAQIVVTVPDDTAVGFDTSPAPGKGKGKGEKPNSIDAINELLGLA